MLTRPTGYLFIPAKTYSAPVVATASRVLCSPNPESEFLETSPTHIDRENVAVVRKVSNFSSCSHICDRTTRTYTNIKFLINTLQDMMCVPLKLIVQRVFLISEA